MVAKAVYQTGDPFVRQVELVVDAVHEEGRVLKQRCIKELGLTVEG